MKKQWVTPRLVPVSEPVDAQGHGGHGGHGGRPHRDPDGGWDDDPDCPYQPWS